MSTTASAPQQVALVGVARALVQAGKLDARAAADLQRSAREQKRTFMSAVLSSGLITAREAAQTLSVTLSVPLLDLDAIDARRIPRSLLDPKIERDLEVMALARRGNRLFLMGSDPTNHDALDRVKFATQLVPEWVLVEHDKLLRIIDTGDSKQTTLLLADEHEEFDFDIEDMGLEEKVDELASDVEDAPVVRFIQKMLVSAVNKRASDLHFEPYEKTYRVRFRVDGELREIASPPVGIKEKLASRIKVLSRLDIAEKRAPQDGRMKLRFDTKAIDFRVSTLPTLYGEKIVIRILDPSAAQMGIDALGYEKIEKERLLWAIKRPYGMVLVTGPTGSGKTVSLYSCLNILNEPGVNIATVEDPAEINLPGVNQVNVNERAGLTFATALKAFLRQDPDIIMVGEIRDLETADIAIKAAQTGHLVLSTLHTNDAPSTLTRLRNMGVPAFNIAASVLLITAQRLVRRLCESCKAPGEYPKAALLQAGYKAEELNDSWRPFRPVGCANCSGGYRGRVGLYQVMPITESIQKCILADGSALDIAAQAAREGVRDMRTAGLIKVMQGVTSLEEVIAATSN